MTEDQLEQETLGWLTDVGYTSVYGPEIAVDGSASGERRNDFVGLPNAKEQLEKATA